MAQKLLTTSTLVGTRVVGGKSGTRHIGKVKQCVFHPTHKKCVGLIVKRPDLLWMFRRSDVFVSIKGFDMVDGRIVIKDDAEATGRAALTAQGIDWDHCVLWLGLPIVSETDKKLGIVGTVTFDSKTGEVTSIESSSGATANALLGKREIPSDLIMGFRRGIGTALALTGEEALEAEQADVSQLGAILVSEDADEVKVEGGLAEKAGKATAVAQGKASKATAAAKEKAGVAAKKAEEAVNKGAYATGAQIGKAKGMFSAFKEEYEKARHDEE